MIRVGPPILHLNPTPFRTACPGGARESDQMGVGNARGGDPGDAEGIPKGAQRGTPFLRVSSGNPPSHARVRAPEGVALKNKKETNALHAVALLLPEQFGACLHAGALQLQ